MKKLFVLAFVLMTVVSCNKDEWKEKVAVSLSEGGAPIIARTFTCKNPEAIKSYLYEKLLESKILRKTETPVVVSKLEKGIGALICTAAIEAILPPLVEFGSEKLPLEWGCTGESIEELGKVAAKEICAKIPL